jgi:hypothetical protein
MIVAKKPLTAAADWTPIWMNECILEQHLEVFNFSTTRFNFFTSMVVHSFNFQALTTLRNPYI